MKKVFLISGGCGFIGSHLVDALLADSNTKSVRVIDDMSSGWMNHLRQHTNDSRLSIYVENLVLPEIVHLKVWRGVDCVFHLAANPDARRGIQNTMLDLQLETIATRNTLEGMRLAGASKIIFASSGTVYGDSGLTVCKEGAGERLPISLYGAGKVASEALISAFCGTFGFSSVIFRFGNVVGERTTHGCIFDFIRQLREHPDHLNVLGDGNQSKPMIYVKEIVAGLIHGLKMLEGYPAGKVEPFNIAPEGATSVASIAQELVLQCPWASLQSHAHGCHIKYGSTLNGWAGDVPHSRMSMAKLEATGFRLERSSDEAVRYAISEILKQL